MNPLVLEKNVPGMFVLIYPFTSQIFCINNQTSCKDLLIMKKIEMTFYSIMESISLLGKMARASAKSENPELIQERIVYLCRVYNLALKDNI